MSYYQDIHNKRIFILGLNPPPFGGVSVHVQRVAKQLSQSNTVYIFDVIKEYSRQSRIRYSIFLWQQLWRFRPTIIHYHTLFLRKNLLELWLLLLYSYSKRSKITIIEHSTRFLYQRSRTYIFFLNRCTKFIDKQVLIGAPMLKAYQDNNIILRNYSVESSFVPPDSNQEKAIYAQYPQQLRDFIAQNKWIMLMNASKFGLWHDQDIYGFDLCIRLMHDFAQSDVALIIAVGTIYDHEHYNFIKQQLQDNPRVYFLIDCTQELWPLIKRVNLFLRPSRYDTCGISVHEAAWLGTPIIASDVAERPPEALIFKSGDYTELRQLVRTALQKNIDQRCGSSSGTSRRTSSGTLNGGT